VASPVLMDGLRRRPSVGEDSASVLSLVHMVQRADADDHPSHAVEAQDRRDLCVFILVENELKSIYLPTIMIATGNLPVIPSTGGRMHCTTVSTPFRWSNQQSTTTSVDCRRAQALELPLRNYLDWWPSLTGKIRLNVPTHRNII